MAMEMDQQQQQQQPQPQPQQQDYKYYCRICKKGFGCGRALGGHMRAHGINDDSVNNRDQDADPSGCSEWGPSPSPPSNKRMYALRPNPNRLKSCRVCENCGKEFVSWKSFLEHGKCSSDDEADADADADADDYYMSSPMSDADDEGLVGHRGWSKGKRSRWAKSAVAATPLSAICPSSEEEDLANCLMLLSSARVDPMFVDEPEESCASASKEEDHRRHHPIAAAANVEKCKSPVMLQPPQAQVPKGMFECKACKKAFTSHQALGGHRASHKKVKGCFAAKLDVGDPDGALLPEDDMIIADGGNAEAAATAMAMAIVPFNNAPLAVTPLKKKSKVHECSICHRQFASGQALGGHKRCHWITSNSGADPNPIAELQQQMHQQQKDPISNRGANQQHQQRYELTLRPMFDASETLDLNMPASGENNGGMRQDIGSPLRLDVPAALYLQPWVDHKNKTTTTSSNNNTTTNINNNNNNQNNNMVEGGCSSVNNNNNVDYEVDSKVKLAKLSELKDMNVGGDQGSPWLQVGIGSPGNEGSREP